MSTAFTRTTSQARFDWQVFRSQVDLSTLAEALLGPADRREGGRLLWRCPFHSERSPSFMIQAGRSTWRCWGCGEHGDAADLVGKLEHLVFPDSARRAAEIVGLYLPDARSTYIPPKPRAQPQPPPSTPTGLNQASGIRLVEESQNALWSDAGAEWLKYLREDRGLSDDTIKAARLGWTPRVDLRTQDDRAYWASGVVIPWFDGGRLASIKLRRTDGRRPKYLEILRDLPRAYPDLESIQPGHPLVIVEGEFDALLLRQEIGDHAAVMTVGSASNALRPDLFQSLLPAHPWYVAVDADEAGERFAASWPSHVRRIRPLGGEKDWSDLHRTGFNRIRYQWGGIIASFRPSWEDLESQRWGNALLVPRNPINPENPGFDDDIEF